MKPNYKAKFGIGNPNPKTIAEMKKQGVEFYVCGQYLAGEKIDPRTLVPDVTVAADALARAHAVSETKATPC